MIDFQLIFDSGPSLMHGAFLSLEIAFLAACLGLLLGTLLGFAETSPSPPLRVGVFAYVTLFRGTPMLVQILFVYYVLPQLGISIAPFYAATLAIGLNSSAYISQIIRSGILAVPKGQIEAAYTLGLNRRMIMQYILLPQAFRVALPSLGNEMVTLIKDSSLASVIGVMELSKEGSIIRSRTYDAFSILFATALIYLLLTSILTLVLKQWEKRHV